MAALMRVLVFCIVNMLMYMGLAVVLVCMFMLIICMTTHFGFTSDFNLSTIYSSNFEYKKLIV
jgi:hypothetical protein